MATQRPLKEGSVRTYQEKVALGFPDILASEMDADLDTIYAAWNGTAGGDLQGNYPNPTIIPAARSKWTISGATLTPTDATKRLAVPGPTASGADQAQILLGTRTMKGRFHALPGYDQVGLSNNRGFNGTNWAEDDVTKAGWVVTLDAAADKFFIQRAGANNAAGIDMLALDSAGRLSIPGAATGDATDQSVLVAGSRTQKGRLLALPGFDIVGFTLNQRYTGSWVNDDATKQAWRVNLDNGSDQLNVWRAPSTGGQGVLVLGVDNAGNLTIAGPNATKASGTLWINPCDRRLKDDVTDYTTGLAAILGLVPRTFIYNGKGGSQAGLRGYGYIADEVEPVMPEMLSTTRAKLDAADEDETDIQTLDTSNITLALVNAVKELAARIAALEAPGARST